MTTPGPPERTGRAPRAALAALSLAALVASASLARGALGGIAHVQDEQGYLLMARIFAGGARTAPAPVDGLLVAQHFQLLSPEWSPVFPPGWPAALALGVAAGAPWLVNPLLSAALPLLAWAALSPRLERRAALLACGVFALSPGVWTLGASMMSHTSVLAAALAAAALIGRTGLGPVGALLAGGLIGWIALARPLDGVLVGGPLLAWGGSRAWRRELGPGALAALVAGAGCGGALLLLDNAALTGDPGTFPVNAYFDQGDAGLGASYRPGCNRLGFGPDRGCQPRFEASGYTLEVAGRHLWANAWRFDRLLLGIPGGALVAFAALMAWARRAPALAATALTVPLGYALYWYHGVCFGARFWHPAYLAAAPAAGIALAWLGARSRPALPWLVLIGGAAATWGPIRAELADDYWCVDAGLADQLAALGVTEGVVLLEHSGERRHRWPLTKEGPLTCRAQLSAGAGLGRNDPMGGAPILWLRAPAEGGDSPGEIAARHPGAPLYRASVTLGAGALEVERWSGAGFSPLP